MRYGDSQIAIYHVPQKGYFATQQVRVLLCLLRCGLPLILLLCRCARIVAPSSSTTASSATTLPPVHSTFHVRETLCPLIVCFSADLTCSSADLTCFFADLTCRPNA